MSTTDLTPTERQAYWSDHIAQWQQSGLSRTAYCKQADINLSQLCYWLKKREPAKPDPSADFIPVSTSRVAAGAEFGLQLPDGRLLQWKGEANPVYIAALYRGLIR